MLIPGDRVNNNRGVERVNEFHLYRCVLLRQWLIYCFLLFVIKVGILPNSSSSREMSSIVNVYRDLLIDS